MNKPLFLSGSALLLTCSPTLQATERQAKDNQPQRPNILWLTYEDTSSFETGCYGNNQVHTPNIDSLAKLGIRFTEAWSVAPQSSPARSTLITGCYAPTYGMDIHPVQQLTPDEIFFPQLLREAGYFCTNNYKTHYNTKVDNTSCWDECRKGASYNSPQRQENQPFFAVFNSHATHMGRVRTFHTDGRRDYTKEGIEPLLLTLPEHVPDLPEIRSDYAAHLEGMQDIDKWVGTFLEDLQQKGLNENTIVFVFSDHGGCLPRGKGYLYETGLRVPLVVYFPPRWQHLAANREKVDSSLVSFTDLAPTVLSLAGVKPQKGYHGHALMGRYADKKEHEYLFAFGSNQLHHYLPVRAMRDKRFKYIRSYMPYRQFALRNYYQWGMPSNMAWDKWVLGGHNTDPKMEQPFLRHSYEQLFDLEADPWELNDLSKDEKYQDVLLRMRKEMSKHLRQTEDLGFFLPSSREGVNVYDLVHKDGYPLEALITAAENTGHPSREEIPTYLSLLEDSRAEMRFWGVAALTQLAINGELKQAPQQLILLMDDPDVYVAAEAALACAYTSQAKLGIQHLVTGREDESKKVFYSSLECLSLDKAKKGEIMPFLQEIEADAKRLPARKNEDAGLMARGILVNLGVMTNFEIYGEDAYQRGLDFNHGRRDMGPRCTWKPAKAEKSK